MSDLKYFLAVFALSVSPVYAEGSFSKFLGEYGPRALDLVPSAESLEPMCSSKLTDIIGVGATATTAAALGGLTQTTATAAPAVALVAGESSLMLISGTSITVVSAPVVGAGLAAAATVATTAYFSGKALCSLSAALEKTHITNEPIPLIMYVDQGGLFDVEVEDDFIKGTKRFINTGKVIPAGTPVLSLGPMSETAVQYYPNYQGRGLLKLGRFFDKDDRPDEGDWVVVPANSVNSIYRDKYTHQLTKDTVLLNHADEKFVVPSGTPFKLHEVKDDGWAEIELNNYKNFWFEDFSSAIEIKLDALKKADLELGQGAELIGPNYENAKAIRDAFINESVIRRKQIQKALKDLNYYTSSIDAKYGPGTERAIIEYARLKKLSTDYPEAIFSKLAK